MKTIRIQPKQRKDFTLPYPFFIDEKGRVGRQDFWKGKPLRLIGFSKTPQTGTLDIYLREFLSNPKLAIKKYPIFEWKDKKRSWHTYLDPIEHIEIIK